MMGMMVLTMGRSAQLELFVKKKRRRGAPPLGRRVRPERIGFASHLTRPEHDAEQPLHVTLRRVAMGPWFRAERVHLAIVAQLANAKRRGIRVLHYSVQDDHLHLMVEGGDRADLAKKLRFLISRIALAVNRVAGRRGSLFRDRYHRRDLASPRQVRNVIRYILFNTRKHADGYESLDRMSSAPWFDRWDPENAPDPELVAQARVHWPTGSPIATPRTWLARAGWLRGSGPIAFDEMPARRY
jgi:REP element-mobilizing transposase RayT